jgi:hypothetical protein
VAKEDLTIYLNDHLAGSVGALELIDHLIKQFAGKPLGHFLTRLRADIESDQKALSDLIDKLGAKESSMRKAGGWLMEKLGRAKIGVTDVKIEDGGLLQALEALVLGISGKQLLWRALAAVAQTSPNLKGTDFGRLEERAIEQIERVETERLRVAREAFAGTK